MCIRDRKKGYEGPLAVIPQFGVDPEIFSPPEGPKHERPVHIAYLGRLVPEKGVDLLLQALNELRGEWQLTIQGGGPEETRLRAMAETTRLKERVSFRPLIPSVNMPEFYRQIDVLVLPSRRQANWMEQFGRVLVEAMACGVTVVGSETGEIPHVIGDAGFTFAENDVAALQLILNRLIRTPELRKTMGSRGRARVLAHFTQRQIAIETLRVYEEMMR